MAPARQFLLAVLEVRWQRDGEELDVRLVDVADHLAHVTIHCEGDVFPFREVRLREHDRSIWLAAARVPARQAALCRVDPWRLDKRTEELAPEVVADAGVSAIGVGVREPTLARQEMPRKKSALSGFSC